mmetsp:Transcript_20740/g.53767  ORF Transcript_20740/g.53767 Transcript_20740/m.53767 type:complete len:113 (-) Transcript_20740:78-416(-)
MEGKITQKQMLEYMDKGMRTIKVKKNAPKAAKKGSVMDQLAESRGTKAALVDMHIDEAVMKKLITNEKYQQLAAAGKFSVKVNPDKKVESKGFLNNMASQRGGGMPAYSGRR